MISKLVLQSTVEGIASIAQREVCVFDPDGRLLVSSSDESLSSEVKAQFVREFADSPAQMQELADGLYYKVFDEDRLEYVLTLSGGGENLHALGKMAAFQLSGLLVAYRERFDRDNFFKNLLLDNLLLVDIYSRARTLRIDETTLRMCLVVRPSGERRADMIKTLRRAVDGKAGCVVTEVSEQDLIVILDLEGKPEETEERAEDARWGTEQGRAFAEQLLAALEQDGYPDVRISCGAVSRDLRDLSRSYKEAEMALDVSRIFYENDRVICYGELGIGRLIYQLPLPLCRMFLSETFGEVDPDREIEEEIAQTVEVFFANSLNVSETARKLFVHRNTLVYRLDKLQKITGLDVRVFEDAITYRIATMVIRYMKYMEKNEY
ncbi:MAG: helix-turn-helix domain-containing protein [Lachnospiraceae bacterium]|nr:helix-turn-helix domain-containing protein [Lachnospiraceae bacterium]